VDKDFGTGALKITPAHDMNDYEISKRHNLASINIFNKDATINKIGGVAYENLDRFVCREKIWLDMEAKNLTLKINNQHAQRIPRSQRGGEVIEPMISTQWFANMNNMAAKAVEAVKTKDIVIFPERFEKVWYNWLDEKNIKDWCISRQLWWGHRIPVFYLTKKIIENNNSAENRNNNNSVEKDVYNENMQDFVVAKNLVEAEEKVAIKKS
jgi:valyl-tRNA synthetase